VEWHRERRHAERQPLPSPTPTPTPLPKDAEKVEGRTEGTGGRVNDMRWYSGMRDNLREGRTRGERLFNTTLYFEHFATGLRSCWDLYLQGYIAPMHHGDAEHGKRMHLVVSSRKPY
jgi:hypothetical protein